MKRVCYFCRNHMGEKDGDFQEAVFYSICDSCALRLRLDERLPELLWAIASLRRKNGSKQNQVLGVSTVA